MAFCASSGSLHPFLDEGLQGILKGLRVGLSDASDP